MYHLKKKFTRKAKRRTGRVNKKNNRKRVTKKVKLSRKKLNKKIKRRPRSVKRGGEGDEEIPPVGLGGGSDDQVESSYTNPSGGEGPDAEEGLGGGSNCGEDHQDGGKRKKRRRSKKQRGGSGCGCGVPV